MSIKVLYPFFDWLIFVVVVVELYELVVYFGDKHDNNKALSETNIVLQSPHFSPLLKPTFFTEVFILPTLSF